jgi:hypothetical protein
MLTKATATQRVRLLFIVVVEKSGSESFYTIGVSIGSSIDRTDGDLLSFALSASAAPTRITSPSPAFEPKGKAVAADAVADQECDEQRPDAEVSDQDVDVGSYEKDEDNNESIVSPAALLPHTSPPMNHLVFGSSR